jgi:DNA repair protein RecO (recombination protein O)
MGTNEAYVSEPAAELLPELEPQAVFGRGAAAADTTDEPRADEPARVRMAKRSRTPVARRSEPNEGAAHRSMFPAHRVGEQPGFILHSYPHRETSLIVDVFSRDHGRIALVAKGAKRPHSALRGALQTFQPLALSWSGKSEVRTLTKAEWIGGMRPLAGDALLCGFYANELLVKFCARDDPHERLFDHYVLTLNRLAHDEPPVQVLRSFERVLLRETGYAIAFDCTTREQMPVEAGRLYVFEPERGVCEAGAGHAELPKVWGQTLIDMEHDDYSRAQTVAQSKTLMRFLLNFYLGGAPLNTRQILIDLQNL